MPPSFFGSGIRKSVGNTWWPNYIEVSLDGVKRAADALVEAGKTRVHLDEAARLAAGSELQIHLRTAS